LISWIQFGEFIGTASCILMKGIVAVCEFCSVRFFTIFN